MSSATGKTGTAEVSVVTTRYDLTLWLLPLAAQFSQAHRFTLGNRIEDAVLEILELLVDAFYTRDEDCPDTKPA